MAIDTGQVPLMQRPGYVYRERKRVLARRLQPGDTIAEGGEHSQAPAKWTVAEVEVTTYMTYVTYTNGQRTCIGSNTDRVWIDRTPKEK